jgi:hypothetical protein
MKAVSRVVAVLFALSILLTAYGMPIPGQQGNTVPINIVYGSEKREWLEPLVQDYNAQGRETPEGSPITVEATPMGSVESARGIKERAEADPLAQSTSPIMEQAETQ